MRYLLLLSLSAIYSLAFSTVNNFKTDNYQEVETIIKQQNVKLKQTLVVFDIDDTLLTMTQPLGSVAWWDWQSKLLAQQPNDPLLFGKTLAELIKTQGILFQLVKMELTDDYLLPFIDELTKQGSHLVALTARGMDYQNATMMQLKSNHLIENEEIIFKMHGISLANHKTSAAGNFQCGTFKRAVAYVDGIMFLAGQDKGVALRCLLKSTKQKFSKIVFVDDTVSNNQAIERAFINDKDINVINILFSKEHPKQAQFLQSLEQQQQSYKQWQNIKQSLYANIAQPVF